MYTPDGENKGRVTIPSHAHSILLSEVTDLYSEALDQTPPANPPRTLGQSMETTQPDQQDRADQPVPLLTLK